MSTFKKLAIPPDEYTTPDGPSSVTPARIQHWHDTFQAMKGAGIRVPLPWGHQPDAEPCDETNLAEKQFWASKYNAGRILDTEIDPTTGALVIHGEGPGLSLAPNGDLVADVDLPGVGRVKSSVGEVSVGVRDWRDGKGRLWPDCLIHCALTPLPVWHGQPGFQPLAAGLQTFSLAGRVTRFSAEKAMADEPKKDDDKKDGTAGKAPPPKKKDGDKGKDDDDGVAAGPPIKDVLADLAEYGIVLPDDTSDQTLKSNLCIALTALKGKETKNDPLSTEGKDKPTEEPVGGGATLMSLAGQNPMVAALVARVETEEKAKRETRIKALVGRGLSPARANKLREAATAQRFSLDAAGKPVAAAVDEQLSLLEDVLPPALDLYSSRLDAAREVVPPEGEAKDKKHTQAADSLARAGGLPARKTA